MRRFLLCLFVTAAVSADEGFLLHVPVREDLTRQTGEVRVTLGLDTPPAGAQLNVDDTNTLTLGQQVTLGNGDRLRFEPGSGNEIRITYQPLSNFATAGNFCVTANATPKELQLRFIGTQNIVDYRISSYSVGAPEIECSQVFRRVGDFPAFLIPFASGTAPELVATNKARHELDVVLVLDKSGSMAGFPPGFDVPPTKAELLRSAITNFIAQWRELDAPGEAAVEFEQDRLGLVFFDTAAAPQPIAGSFFTERGPGGTSPTHQWNPVVDRVNTLAPGGFTTIGGGINAAFEQWQADPDHDLTLIVVTDGIQNTAPLVEKNADGILTLAPVSGFPAELRKRFTPIYTIGFGTPSGVDLALLNDIAGQTTGFPFLAVNANTLFDSFGSTLVSFLKGNTISHALRQQATMTGAGPAAAQPLIVDRSVPRVVVSVQWAPPLNDALDLEVLGPDGTIRTPTSTSRTGTAVIQRFDLRPADAGDWSVRVKRAQSAATTAIPYSLSAFLVEEKLDYQLVLEPVSPATGDAIRVRARVAYDRKPLNKLPGNAIRVRVQRPPEALGTILHDTRGGSAPATPDVQSAYHRKLAAITDASLIARVYPRDVETITLAEERPGVYAGTFSGTSVPGTYGFEAVLDWDDSRTGHVRRVERLEREVKLKPDPIATTVVTTRADGNRTLFAVTPRDRFGNYLGPGYEPIVRATLNGPGTISTTPVDRDQTGEYIFTVTDGGASPDVNVTVGGVQVDVGPDNPVGASPGKWRLFLDAGPTITHGGRRAYRDGVFSINAGLERPVTPNISIEAILGYHRFDNAIGDARMWQVSLGGKYWFGASTLRPFVDGSLGAYLLDPGSTRFGASAGGGLLYQLTPTLGLEAVYHFTNVNTEGDSVSFSTLQGGVRFSF